MKLLSLMKKEFLRFFRDPRLIVTMLLPGILVYAIYSLLGNAIWNEKTSYEFRVYAAGDSAVLAQIEAAVQGNEGWSLEITATGDLDEAKEKVEKGDMTALLVFPENFDEAVDGYSPASGERAPQIEIYYRSADEESAVFYSLACSVFDAYESALSNKFDVTAGDFSNESAVAADVMVGILPFIVVVFIFSACMSVTLESVAGEKERGTLATILVTSVKRSHVALGKVIPLSCISSIGAASSFLGVALSMPKLMGVSLGSVAGGIGFVSYFLIFLLIISVVPLIVAAISVVSTFARSVKEASAYTSVIMILVMVLSLVSGFVGSIGDWIVAVPVLNAVSAMQEILTMSLSVWKSLTAVAVNFAFTALLVFAISKMLSSERIMFGK